MTAFKKNIVLSLFLLLTYGLANGQQLPLYSQYMNNGFLLNPAMAGYDGYTSVNLTTRKQWVGFDNAPVTYSFSAQTRLLKNSYNVINKGGKSRLSGGSQGRVGIGGYFFNDINGLVSRTGVQLTYAYHIDLYESQLSLGLAGQMFQYKIDEDQITLFRGDDPFVNGNLNTVAYIPDAHFGAFWTSREWFMGLSVNQLFQSVLKLGSTDLGNLKLLRHYYLMGGYRLINERSGFDFEPSVLVKTTEQFIPQADFTFKVYYNTDYWLGMAYRTSGSIAGMFGVRSHRLYIGYAYDYALSSIRKYSFGSHELILSVKFGSNARRFRWLNRY